MCGILDATEQMCLIFSNFPAAGGTFVDGIRINLIVVFAGTAGSEGLLIVHIFHSLYVEVDRESSEVETKQRVVDVCPVVVTPCKLLLHVGSKVVAVNVEAEHGAEMAGDEEAVDGKREFHGSKMWNLLAGKDAFFKAVLSGEGIHGNVVQRVSG